MKFLALILFCVGVAQAGLHPGIQFPEKDLNSRIIQGWPAAQNQFPHQVYLRMTSTTGGGAACGGSLISARWVLTAAHCIKGMRSAQVRLGSTNVNTPAMIVESTNLIVHPNYNQNNLNNDIGLIGLNQNVAETASIKYIALPRLSQQSDSFANRLATVSGWGYTANNGPVSSTLNYVNLTIITNQRCQQDFGSIIIPSTICGAGIQSSAQGACSGDSGGSMIMYDNNDRRNIQIGVVSFVSSLGCSSSAPSGFVRPHHFWSWISSNTGIPIRQ